MNQVEKSCTPFTPLMEDQAKARFFASVSHDLKQHVHAIGLFLDPLLRTFGAAPDPLVRRSLNGIQQSRRSLDELLSELLDLARLDAGSFRPTLESVELHDVLGKVVLQHSASAEKAGVRLVILSSPGRTVVADEMMLRRVISNLLDNAIKFSGPGQTVVLNTRPAGDRWMIQVRDAGPGIEASSQERIFEEFVRIESVELGHKNGYGLGLAIVRRLVCQLNGEMKVRSRLGCGCCMSVYLPKAGI
jgi:signal transduction histidine kinase